MRTPPRSRTTPLSRLQRNSRRTAKRIRSRSTPRSAPKRARPSRRPSGWPWPRPRRVAAKRTTQTSSSVGVGAATRRRARRSPSASRPRSLSKIWRRSPTPTKLPLRSPRLTRRLRTPPPRRGMRLPICSPHWTRPRPTATRRRRRSTRAVRWPICSPRWTHLLPPWRAPTRRRPLSRCSMPRPSARSLPPRRTIRSATCSAAAAMRTVLRRRRPWRRNGPSANRFSRDTTSWATRWCATWPPRTTSTRAVCGAPRSDQ
mmetsp:Transcript_5371/g.13495  ORF Transcript_5371/g.13495 Transcript_5371/m.13495 type:complete len:259 (-) Transcript_5371:796-1572(-)